MKDKTLLWVALLILIPALILFLLSLFVQPLLAPPWNSAVILLGIVLAAVLATLSGIFDTIQLVDRIKPWITTLTQTKQERAKQQYEKVQQHLRTGDVAQAMHHWEKWQEDNALQEFFSDEARIAHSLLALARLDNQEEVKIQIQNGRNWPDACVGAFVAAWEKCRRRQFAADCEQTLQAAYHLLPISEAAPDLQDRLARIAVELVARAKDKGEFAPIKSWPVPPRQPTYPTSVPPWAREAIPGGQDPFPQEKAEHDLFNLFRGRENIAFWGGHPLFNRLFTTDHPTLVSGSTGSGRTALAHAIHYYAPRRETLALHIPGAPAPDTIRRRFARHLLDFVLHYPQNLRFLTGANRMLLANFLAEVSGKTALNARIENEHANLYTALNPLPQEEKDTRGEQLQLLSKAVSESSLLPQSLNWMEAVSTIAQALRFKQVLLVLDAPQESDAWVQETIFSEPANWQTNRLTTILFLPDVVAKKLGHAKEEFYQRSLVWDRNSFYKMLQWRYKAFTGSLFVLEQHFAPNALEQMIEQCFIEGGGYNPRRFMQLWRVIMSEMPPNGEAQISSKEIRRASQEIEETMTMRVDPESRPALLERDGEEIIAEKTAVSPSPNPALLRRILNNYFSLSELRALSFDLGVDYGNFPPTKPEMPLEMAAYFQRHGRLNELWQEICRQRPNLCQEQP